MCGTCNGAPAWSLEVEGAVTYACKHHISLALAAIGRNVIITVRGLG